MGTSLSLTQIQFISSRRRSLESIAPIVRRQLLRSDMLLIMLRSTMLLSSTIHTAC
jgi:hypothetical protein